MGDFKSILGVLLVFVLGALAGAFLALSIAHHRVTTLLQHGSPAYEQLLERRLGRGLHLDAIQRAQFHEALVENIEKRKQLQKQIQPQVQQINLETRTKLHAFLSLDQLEQLQRNLQDFRARFGAPGLNIGHPAATAADSTNGAPASSYAATNSVSP